MIYTGNYKNCTNKKMKTYSISWDMGKDANYFGEYYLELAPKLDFFRKWKDNRNKVDFLENTKYYIREYYNRVLKHLNVKEVYEKLDNSILLCYEDSDEFCHRHIVAAWFENELGIKIREIQFLNDEIIYYDRPKYIDEIFNEVINKE